MKIELYRDDQLRHMYDQFLDEVCEATIAGRTYAASLALQRVDPVAYHCGYNDWLFNYLEDNPHVRDADDAEGRVVYWKCPECGDAYDAEDEAEECCN